MSGALCKCPNEPIRHFGIRGQGIICGVEQQPPLRRQPQAQLTHGWHSLYNKPVAPLPRHDGLLGGASNCAGKLRHGFSPITALLAYEPIPAEGTITPKVSPNSGFLDDDAWCILRSRPELVSPG